VLVSLVSAKGSPGVTTAAAALAAVGVERRLAKNRRQPVDLAELDPSGGDVEPLTGVTGESGLLRAASELRAETLLSQVVEAPRGVRSLLVPTSALEANATVMAALDVWCAALSSVGGMVVADAGRWERAHPAAARLVGSDVVAVVCRPDARGVEHVRHILTDVRSLVWPVPVVVITVGSHPYGDVEVAASLGLTSVGALAWDPKGATALWAEGVGRRLGRWSSSALARSARTVLGELVRVVWKAPAA
jgi:hypothetical protein